MSMWRAGPGGVAAMQRLMDEAAGAHPPFAPPFLKDGDVMIAQTANILLYLGRRHGLAPRNEAGRLWAHQLQLTIADIVDEAHDTHHPIASSLYYEDQQAEARRRAADFIANRIPKYLGYFERVLERNPRGGRHLVGARVSYCDLSLFQLVAGLRYAFPQAMAALEPRLSAGRRAARPRRRTAAPCRLSEIAAAHRLQRARYFPPLPGTRRCTTCVATVRPAVRAILPSRRR